jgi:hypothetical protein
MVDVIFLHFLPSAKFSKINIDLCLQLKIKRREEPLSGIEEDDVEKQIDCFFSRKRNKIWMVLLGYISFHLSNRLHIE